MHLLTSSSSLNTTKGRGHTLKGKRYRIHPMKNKKATKADTTEKEK
jgi:hypothetical protein